MFQSLSEDVDYLRQVVRPWREWETVEEACQLNTYSVQTFCLILQYVQFHSEPETYQIKGYRTFRFDDGTVSPGSMELTFGCPGGPKNTVWFQDGLIGWSRDRDGDFPLVGVPAVQQFIKSLHVN